MKKFTELMEKMFSYNNIIFLISCIVYAIVCVLCFLFDNFWILLGAVILNIVLVTAMYLIYEKRIKKIKGISEQLQDMADNIEEVNRGNKVAIENTTDVQEIEDIKENLVTIVDKYNDRLTSTVFINDMAIDFKEDRYLHIATKESFESQLPLILQKASYYRSLFCLVKLCGGEDKAILRDLCVKIKDAFPKSILAIYDEYTISVLVLNVAGKAEIEGAVEYLASTFAKAIPSTFEDRVDVYYDKIGAVMYPNTNSEDVIAAAKEALDKDGNINFYEAEEVINVNSKRDDNKAFLMRYLDEITEKANATKTAIERLDLVKDILVRTAELYEYNHSDIFMVSNNHINIECLFDKYTNQPGRMFRDRAVRTVDQFDLFRKYFDRDDTLYFSDVIDLNPEIKEYFQNYQIQSAFQAIIKKDGEIIGFISLESDKANVGLDAEEKAALSLVIHIISELMITYYSEIGERRYSVLIDSLSRKVNQYLYMIDKETNRITYISETLKDKLPEASVGQLCYEAIYGKDKPCNKCPLKEAIIAVENEKLGKDLSASVLNYFVSPAVEAAVLIEDKNLAMSKGKVVVEDYDPIISIKNVNALHKDIDTLLRAKKTGYIALLNIDDYNKQIEFISQDEVNKMLVVLSNKLEAQGYKDIVYRFNDSTFAFILEDAKRPDALAQMEKIYDIASQNIEVDDYEIKFNYHCAIAMYPNDIRDVNKIDRVLNTCRDESIALGLNCTYIYGEKGGRQAERKKYILDFIDDAIAKDKFEIYIQPIVALDGKKTPVYGEVLLRLKDPQRGFIPPNEFVPIANANNRMFGVEMSILNQVGELWKTYGYTIFHQVGVERISINISSSSLNNPDFVARVTQICRKYKFGKDFLQFEINERIIGDNLDVIVGHIKDLQQYNISWSLDNFGTGKSDLQQLLSLGFNQVKVDRSFIMDIDTNERNKISVSFITSSANKAGLSVVAEGVETSEQLDACKEIGFTSAQGYYFSKPIAVNDYIKYLNFGK